MTGQKTGGRTKGTPNKVTSDFREKLKGILFAELETLPEQLQALQPEQRLNMTIKLLAYVFPKPQSGYDEPSSSLFDDDFFKYGKSS